jgi:hypothetical protein
MDQGVQAGSLGKECDKRSDAMPGFESSMKVDRVYGRRISNKGFPPRLNTSPRIVGPSQKGGANRTENFDK